MLKSLKKLNGEKLGASDGEIGHVKDFYFDDQNWAVRYIVADTGTWLTSRLVLLSPLALGDVHLAGKLLEVSLTRKQIEECPSIESHKPISRQYEEEYHHYYGWPSYWLGDGLWGMSGMPILVSPPKTWTSEKASASKSPDETADAHLRSAQAVNGYHIQATDGTAGHVCDFLMDTETWAIQQLVVKTGHRFTGKEMQIPVSSVIRISYDESSIFVNLSTEAIEKSPGHTQSPFSPAP